MDDPTDEWLRANAEVAYWRRRLQRARNPARYGNKERSPSRHVPAIMENLARALLELQAVSLARLQAAGRPGPRPALSSLD